MKLPSYAVALEAENAVSDDHVKIIEFRNTLIIAVADGAGGLSGSTHAAKAVVQAIETLIELEAQLDEETTWIALLANTDQAIRDRGNWGQTTAVILAATDRWICGASVGDSEAWLATTDDFRHLTAAQNRKPLLGSGSAMPVSFRRQHLGGTLVVGTDGLFKCAPAWRVCQTATGYPPDDACRILLDLVRLPNGRFRDDVGIALCNFDSR